MRLAIRIFLYGILSLVIALWLVLGLFKSDYLKAPLAAWIQPQTGLPLSSDSAEVAALRAGKPYHGMVNRNGRFYMSYFDPVLDARGQVIGALSVRISMDALLQQMPPA